jgi:hypothetical protein
MNERTPPSPALRIFETVAQPHDLRLTEWVYICDRCGERMEERKCKIVCGNCGLTRDCSDP